MWARTRSKGSRPLFSGDGKHIYFVGVEERAGDIWELSWIDGAERPVTDLKARRGEPGFHSVSRDGTSLCFTWREDLGDIWVMDVVDRNE